MKKPGYWYCDVWKMNYWYFIGWAREDFDCWIQKRHDSGYTTAKGAGGTCLSIENSSGQRIAIWIKPQKRVNLLAALTHECIHAAHFTLSLRGVRSDFENDEPVTYLAEAIFREGLT